MLEGCQDQRASFGPQLLVLTSQAGMVSWVCSGLDGGSVTP